MNTHQMPDMLMLGEDPETKESTAQVGTVRIPIRKAGRRSTDSMSELVISLSDLRRLIKEAGRVGWSRHVEHVKDLRAKMIREIGD